MTIYSTDADRMLTLLTQYRRLRDQMFSTGEVHPDLLAQFAGEEAHGTVRAALLPLSMFDRAVKFDLYLLRVLEQKMAAIGFRYYDLAHAPTIPEVIFNATI